MNRTIMGAVVSPDGFIASGGQIRSSALRLG